MVPVTATSILASFPHATISPMGTDTTAPNFASIQAATLQLNANATSIASNRGGGNHGHLAITIHPDRYFELAGEHFEIPLNPPIHPVHPDPATAPVITEINRRHLVACEEFNLYRNVQNVLRTQTIAAVPSAYIKTLAHPEFGFGNVSVLAIVTHLKTVYGRITPAELQANLATMALPWSTQVSIEILFTQLDDAIAFSIAGNDEISSATAVRAGYTIIENTGLFTSYCRDWRRTPAADQTLPTFKIFFRDADRDRRLTATTETAGFHGAYQAAAIPPAYAPAALQYANQAAAQLPPTHRTPARTPATYTYCWSHGSTRNISHTSMSCQNKANGHQDHATAENKMNGSTKIWTAPVAPAV